MAEEVQVAVLERGDSEADNIVSNDVLGLRFARYDLVLSVKVSVVLQVDVALNFSFLLGGSCITSL